MTIAETSDSWGDNPYWVMGTTYDSWSESTVTYDSFYGSASLNNIGSDYFEGNNHEGYLPPVSLNIGSISQADYFDDGYLTLAIWAGDWTFASPSQMFGADSGFEPILEIDFEVLSVDEPTSSAIMVLFGLGIVMRLRRKTQLR